MAPRKKEETATTEVVQVQKEQVPVTPPNDAVQPPGTSEQSPESPTPTEPPEMVRAMFLTNCKHNRDYYRAGQKLDLPENVFETLLHAKAVRRLGE